MALSDWIDIFKGGKQKDSQGNEHNGDELIAKAIAGHKPSEHEVPICIGHPEHDAPAYGWVESLKETVRDGAKVLQAKLKLVDPAFAEMVEAGRFNKRSAAFYPDGGLRHVGFLGASPPAVKGLNPVFKADTGFNEFTSELENKINEEKEDMDAKELEKLKAQAQQAEAAKAKAEADNEKLNKEFAEFKAQSERAQHQAYLDKLSADGIILPYQIPGLLTFMETLSEKEKTINFTEADGKKIYNPIITFD